MAGWIAEIGHLALHPDARASCDSTSVCSATRQLGDGEDLAFVAVRKSSLYTSCMGNRQNALNKAHRMRIQTEALTFDDVLLLPAYSEVLPRQVDA